MAEVVLILVEMPGTDGIEFLLVLGTAAGR
jgi:hypothetical protein